MDDERRREVRAARRLRRRRAVTAATAADETSNNNRSATTEVTTRARGRVAAREQQQQQQQQGDVSDERNNARSGDAAAAITRRRRLLTESAARLSSKMQRRRDEQRQEDEARAQREAAIQRLYAPHVVSSLLARTAEGAAAARSRGRRRGGSGNDDDYMSLQQQQQDDDDGGASSSSLSRAAAAALARDAGPPMDAFDQDAVLGALMRDARGNFVQIDRTLATDHALAVRRLHSAVFAHTNDFLLLFRDVARASERVEELKSCVQGIKTTIAQMNRFSYADLGSLAQATGSRRGRGSALATTAGDDDDDDEHGAWHGHTRSGVFTRGDDADGGRTRGHYSDDDDDDSSGGYTRRLSLVSRRVYARATRLSRLALRARRQANNNAAAAVVSDAATTHDVHVASLLLWRYYLRGGGGGGDDEDDEHNRDDDDNDDDGSNVARVRAMPLPSSSPPSRATLQRFVAAVREELDERMAEQRHDEAAQLLRSIADSAVVLGCLPLVLDCEAAVVYAVVEQLHSLPATPLYMESVHVPLLQLLLRFGRTRTAMSTYLTLQGEWLRGEAHTLQARVSPAHASRVTVDFLVRAMRATVRRQRTLAHTLDEAARLDDDDDKHNNNDNNNKHNNNNNKTSDAAPRRLPANAAALLWVRAQTLRFAREVLATHVLSYGVGTDGGDVSRLRRAARLVSEAAQALRTMARDGFAGCEAMVLRQLTPSVLQLEAAFVQWQVERVTRAQRAMAEQLHDAVRRHVRATITTPPTTTTTPEVSTAATLYVPSACADVARKSNVRCHALLRVVQCLPHTPHTWLLQLLLAPASAVAAATTTTTTTAQHRFFRYANGCTIAHVQLVESLLQFLAALSGSDVLPAQLLQQQRQSTRTTSVTRHVPGASSTTTTTTTPRRSAAAGDVDHDDGNSTAVACSNERALRAHVRIAALLLGSALVTDSVDVTLHTLLDTCLRNTATQRDALLQRLTASRVFAQSQRTQHASTTAVSSSSSSLSTSTEVSATPLPWYADAARSPGWVLDSQLAQLADVLSVAVWASYIGSGNALAHVYTDASLQFRARHVEQLQRRVPRVVQSTLAVALALAHDAAGAARRAQRRRTVASKRDDDDDDADDDDKKRSGDRVATPTTDAAGATRRTRATATTPTTTTTTRNDDNNNKSNDDTSHHRHAAQAFLALAEAAVNASGADGSSGSSNVDTRQRRNDDNNSAPTRAATAAAPSVTTPTAVMTDGATTHAPHTRHSHRHRRRHHRRHRDDALLSVPVIDYTTRNDDHKDNDGHKDDDDDNNNGDEVRAQLLPLLATLLEQPFRTPRAHTAHRYASDDAVTGVAAMSSRDATAAATANANSNNNNSSSRDAVATTLAVVRRVVRSYPAFPLGRAALDRHDELFLFHWFAQTTLHLLAFMQERLLTPSHVVNARAADAARAATFASSPSSSSSTRTPAATTATMTTTSAMAWPVPGCVSPRDDDALAVLCAGGGNFVAAVAVMQFLVARLLRDALCVRATWDAVYAGGAAWRGDAAVLRQQVFFFALYVRFWSPLYARNSDATSALAVLQSLSCSGDDAAYNDDKRNESDDAHAAPTVLLRSVLHFISDELREPQAAPALTSAYVRNRVERALADIDVRDYVGTTFDSDDDDNDSNSNDDSNSDDNDDTTTQRVTMHDLRDYLTQLVRPLA